MQNRTDIDERFDKEKLRSFNEKVFATMPDEPYLGPVPAPVASRKVSVLDWCFRAAAVILAGVLLWTLMHQEAVPEPVAEAAAADLYVVPEGVRSRVTLPDSTVVWLNSGSELKVAAGFGDGRREVSLQGEGYFEVMSSPSDPFLIHTPAGATVKVTGTKFNLSCYSPHKEVRLTLLKGSVELLTPEKDVLTVAEGAKITLKGNYSSTDESADIEGDTAWTRGTLHFDNTSMREVLESIERWYGVNITVRDNSVYRNSFTADFRSESINQVLELLSITCDIVYVMDGREIILG